MKKIFAIFFVLIISVKLVFPFTYLGSIEGFGDPVISVTGRALGMGNASVASSSGVNSIFYNPANMLKVRRTEINAGSGLYLLKETVKTDQEPTMYSSVAYLKLTGIAVMYPLGTNLRIGAGYRPVSDFNYAHDKKSYSKGVLTETIDYAGGGELNCAVIAVAVSAGPAVNLSFNYNISGGRYKNDDRVISIESAKVTKEANGRFKGSGCGFGVNWEPVSDVMNIGFMWSLPFKVENKWNTKTCAYIWKGAAWGDDTEVTARGRKEYEIPDEIGIGMSYKFLGRQSSIFAVDIVRTFWKDFRYKETKDTTNIDYNKKLNPHYRNTTRISVGVEHYLTFNTVLRYGFTHLPHYSRTSCDTTMFTVGVGFSAGRNIGFDIALGYGRRNFYGKNVFFYTDEMVDERIAKLICSTNLRF